MNKRNRTVRSIICVLLSIIILFSIISIPSGKAEAAGSNIDDFITSCYRICLNREPTEADLEHWEGELLRGERCGSDAVFCFVFGPEYVGLNKSDEEFIEDMYRTFLLREYDAPGKEFWMKKFSEERWSREQVFAGFANSDEFFGLCLSYGITAGYFDSNYDHEQINKVNTFVARLYKICLNRIGDKQGQQNWVVSLLSNENSGMKCAEGFVKSIEYRGLNLTEEQYVENMYKLMLGRDSDEGGKAHWLNNLAHGMSKDALFYSFARSEEFTNICKDYGIVSINEVIPSAKPDGTFIMYFSGIDADGADPSMNRNSDVNILAVVNTKTRHIYLIHTPRDYYVNTPYGNGQKDKLTHAGLYGIENSIGTMETLYGINIDYYFKTNFI